MRDTADHVGRVCPGQLSRSNIRPPQADQVAPTTSSSPPQRSRAAGSSSPRTGRASTTCPGLQSGDPADSCDARVCRSGAHNVRRRAPAAPLVTGQGGCTWPPRPITGGRCPNEPRRRGVVRGCSDSRAHGLIVRALGAASSILGGLPFGSVVGCGDARSNSRSDARSEAFDLLSRVHCFGTMSRSMP